MPRLRVPDPDLPVIVTSAEAMRAGLTRDQIRQRVRSGAWTPLVHGAYSREPRLDDRTLHVHRAIAAVLTHPGSVIAHESAAVVHGLPLHRRIPAEIRLCVPPGHWTGARGSIGFRAADIPEQHVTRLDLAPLTSARIPVLSPAATWAQIAARGRLADGLVPGDAGLRAGRFTQASLRQAVMDLDLHRGIRRIREALHHLDAGRESPLESQSWAYLVRRGLPLPELQVDVIDDSGFFVGRVDLLWREARIIGEVDGRMKYAMADDLYREKRREDRLRELGFQVVRWGSADLRDGILAHRLRTLLIRRPLRNAS